MEFDFVYVSSIIVAIILVCIAGFQVLLSLGYPLGEFAMGGYHKVLPRKLRIVSAINAVILLFIALVILQHTSIIEGFHFLSTNILVWVITIFLGLNTIANLFSRSKKERNTMTPLSGFTFLLCLIIALS